VVFLALSISIHTIYVQSKSPKSALVVNTNSVMSQSTARRYDWPTSLQMHLGRSSIQYDHKQAGQSIMNARI
jgi:hypothetical protein